MERIFTAVPIPAGGRQVPDTMGTYPNWDAGKPSASGDWRDLDSVFPKK